MKHQRRSVPLQGPSLTLSELDTVLRHLRHQSLVHHPVSGGLFSVLSFKHNNSDQNPVTSPNLLSGDDGNSAESSQTNHRHSSVSSVEISANTEVDLGVGDDEAPQPPGSSGLSPGIFLPFSEAFGEAIELPDALSSASNTPSTPTLRSEPPEVRVSHCAPTPQTCFQPRKPREERDCLLIHQPTAITMAARHRLLIHHWVTHLSKKLLLIDEPTNPCRTALLPVALTGYVSASEGSLVGSSVLHAICACSAYNIFELSGRQQPSLYASAIQHEYLVTTHLRRSIVENDKRQDPSLGLAIMSCVMIEAVSGSPGRWRTHLAGAIGSILCPSPTKSHLNESHVNIVAMAILCDIDLPYISEDLFERCSFDTSSNPFYGMGTSTLRSLVQIKYLGSTKDQQSEDDLDAFETWLYLDFPADYHHLYSKPTDAVVVYHMAKAFYYARLVLFQRGVRQRPLDMVQDLVQAGVCELEAIETMTSRSTACGILWPSLILAADCGTRELQNRMRSWFQCKQRLGLRSINYLHERVNLLWAYRASATELVNVIWHDFEIGLEYDVLPV